MSDDFVDLKLIDIGKYYDVSFAANGDFNLVKGLETSLTVSFFTNARASDSEVINSSARRGWWGDLYKIRSDYPNIGSKLWLLSQSYVNQNVINNAIAYTQLAYAWITSLNYADKVNVSANIDGVNLNILIKIIKNNDVINDVVFNLWKNTTNEID